MWWDRVLAKIDKQVKINQSLATITEIKSCNSWSALQSDITRGNTHLTLTFRSELCTVNNLRT
jgi:hypothetical protein